jgi:hypothetical protein
MLRDFALVAMRVHGKKVNLLKACKNVRKMILAFSTHYVFNIFLHFLLEKLLFILFLNIIRQEAVKKNSIRHPIQLPNYMGCMPHGILHVFLKTLFYTKMSFKILKFSNRPSCQSFPRAIYFRSRLLCCCCCRPKLYRVSRENPTMFVFNITFLWSHDFQFLF